MIRAGLVNQKAKSARDRREEQNATDQNISIRQYGRKPKVHMHESLIFIHTYIHCICKIHCYYVRVAVKALQL